jgi:phosphoserine phosphatase
MTQPALLLHRPPDPATPTAASDLEGTLFDGTIEAGLRGYLSKTSRAPAAKAFLRRRAPGYFIRKALRLDLRQYKNDWMRDLLTLFEGMPLAEFDEACEWVVERNVWGGRRQAVIRELNAHLAAGRRAIIVTGMFEPLLKKLLLRLPGMEAICTAIVVENGRFTGRLATDFQVGAKKRDNLLPFAGAGGKIYAAYGDTAADIHMLEMAEHPAAVHPDRRLCAVALARGWRILEE